MPAGLTAPPYAKGVPSLLLTTVKYTHWLVERLTVRLRVSVPRLGAVGLGVGEGVRVALGVGEAGVAVGVSDGIAVGVGGVRTGDPPCCTRLLTSLPV